MDPKVTRITSVLTIESFVVDFGDRFQVLKADVTLSFFRVESCLSTETICLGRSLTESPFFYMYSCLFSDLHISLPFDNFMMGVLKALNVAPTQLHLDVHPGLLPYMRRSSFASYPFHVF